MITAAPTTTTATSSPDCTACAAEFSSKGGCNFYDAKQGEFTGNADSLIPAGCMPCVAVAKALCSAGPTPTAAATTAGPACVVPKAAFTEKARGCATENECFDGKTLNNNTGFDTFAEAWAACGDAANAGCAHIIHTPGNFDNTPRGKMLNRQYFLRKDTDPIRDNLPNGGMPFVACKGICAPLGCASASIALGHPRASGAARPRSSPRAKALLFNSREAAAMIHLDDPVPHTVDTH